MILLTDFFPYLSRSFWGFMRRHTEGIIGMGSVWDRKLTGIREYKGRCREGIPLFA
jgi:hypothetical protein